MRWGYDAKAAYWNARARRDRARAHERWWTANDVAQSVGVDPRLVTAWIRRGWLHASMDAAGRWRIRPRALDRALGDLRVIVSMGDSAKARERAAMVKARREQGRRDGETG